MTTREEAIAILDAAILAAIRSGVTYFPDIANAVHAQAIAATRPGRLHSRVTAARLQWMRAKERTLQWEPETGWQERRPAAQPQPA